VGVAAHSRCGFARDVVSGWFVFIVAHAGDELLLLGARVRESLSHLSHFHVEGVL